ncbi:MAG: hypothetical protein LBI61_00305 [Puniceicoccales bacterium]|nr:hypothetical protein [Puniceicoccales bacterium]
MKNGPSRIGKALAGNEILFSCTALKKTTKRERVVSERERSTAFGAWFESRRIKVVETESYSVTRFKINGMAVSARVFRKCLCERLGAELGQLQCDSMKDEAKNEIEFYGGAVTVSIRHCIRE